MMGRIKEGPGSTHAILPSLFIYETRLCLWIFFLSFFFCCIEIVAL